MLYLHRRANVIQRDLKSHNLLIDNFNNIKVGSSVQVVDQRKLKLKLAAVCTLLAGRGCDLAAALTTLCATHRPP
jgi:serine/threonine protein kinase